MEALASDYEAILAECRRGFDNDSERAEYQAARAFVEAELVTATETARQAVAQFNARQAA